MLEKEPHAASRTQSSPAAEAGPTVTKAILRAADRLGISNKVVGSIVGTLRGDRIAHGQRRLHAPSRRQAVRTVGPVRPPYRSLDAITGGDDAVARAWLRSENSALGGTPLTLVQTVQGLVNVIAYLDARRAVG